MLSLIWRDYFNYIVEDNKFNKEKFSEMFNNKISKFYKSNDLKKKFCLEYLDFLQYKPVIYENSNNINDLELIQKKIILIVENLVLKSQISQSNLNCLQKVKIIYLKINKFLLNLLRLYIYF